MLWGARVVVWALVISLMSFSGRSVMQPRRPARIVKELPHRVPMRTAQERVEPLAPPLLPGSELVIALAPASLPAIHLLRES